MSKKLVFIHTVLSTTPVFDDLAREILPPDLEVYHLGDDMLAKVAVKQGGLSPFHYRRLAEHVIAAENAGADIIQVTCSSISPCVDPVRRLVHIPVLKIDEAMAAKAVSLGGRIGIAATAISALRPTADLVAALAAQKGKQVDVEIAMCEGAYDALFASDLDTHDQIIQQTLGELTTRNDVILLAQASMARAVDTIPTRQNRVPILTSPRLAIERVREVIIGLDSG